jgi:hypothetical protein
MKHFLSALLLSALLCISPARIAAQTASEAMSNPVILGYYSAEELSEMERDAPEKLAAIIYYYTASFTVEPVECDDCIPFDPALFDVSKYEQYRLADETYSRTFEKYGFRLTLVPVNQLTYKLPVHLPIENR